MKRNFEDILNDCLDRLSRGETIRDCLHSYPEQAEELASMLQVAQATREATSQMEPRPEFQARVLYRLSRQMAEGRLPKRNRLWIPTLARPVVLAVAVTLAVLGGAAGTTVAASDSVPGEPLYVVKTLKEKFLLSIPRSEIARARFQANLADTRNQEMATLISQGDVDMAEKVAERLNRHLEKATAAVINRPAASNGRETRLLRDYIKKNWQRHQVDFNMAIEHAPQGMRLRIRQSLGESSGRMFEAAIAALGETNGVILRAAPESNTLTLRTQFGPPVRLNITGSTKIMMGDKEVLPAQLGSLQNGRVWIDYDPQTLEVREIRILR